MAEFMCRCRYLEEHRELSQNLSHRPALLVITKLAGYFRLGRHVELAVFRMAFFSAEQTHIQDPFTDLKQAAVAHTLSDTTRVL